MLNLVLYSTYALVLCYVLVVSDVAPWLRHLKVLAASFTLILCTFSCYVLLVSEEIPDIEDSEAVIGSLDLAKIIWSMTAFGNRNHRFYVITWPVASTPPVNTRSVGCSLSRFFRCPIYGGFARVVNFH